MPASSSTPRQSRYPLELLGLWFMLALILIGRCLQLTDRRLIYTLDDPYIHLALAENIRHGVYGINGGEPAAPASSILYPLLLAVTECLGLGEWGPLLLNLAAMGLAVWLAGQILQQHILPQGSTTSDAGGGLARLFPLMLGLAVCCSMNAWGLVMTGMEHSLHVLAVVAVLWGFLECLRNQAAPSVWLIGAIAALPLIRFEGLALSGLSILALCWLRQWRSALTALALATLGLSAWLIFTRSQGLPPLPSSVLLKSSAAARLIGESASGSLMEALRHNLRAVFGNLIALELPLGFLALTGLGIAAWRERHDKAMLALLGPTLGAVLAQTASGYLPSFMRYEVYALTLITLTGLALAQRCLANPWVKVAALLAVSAASAPCLLVTLLTPTASRGIYLQQYQMHRFAVDYWRQSVGVNDLGWVSYRNPAYVLDLYGLGSEEVCRLKLRNALDDQAVRALAERKQVHLFMLYDDWFTGRLPAEWRKVAVLQTPAVSAHSGQVSFYAAPAVHQAELLLRLREFAGTLPEGASILLTP